MRFKMSFIHIVCIKSFSLFFFCRGGCITVFHVHGLEDNFVMISIFPKSIYQFNAILIKIPAACLLASFPSSLIFSEIDQLITKIIWKYKGPKIFKKIFKKNRVRRLTFPIFKIYCNATVIKAIWYWHQNRPMK